MNTPNLLKRVLDLTLQMEHAAQLDDWEGAARIARERNPLLMSIGAPGSDEAKAAIERIRALTIAINQQAEAAQTELAAEYRSTITKASGAAAYQRGVRF